MAEKSYKKNNLSKAKHKTPKDTVSDTGHQWDGIRELNNPDPFWLRGAFYIALFFALGYWILYPSWPTPGAKGVLETSQYDDLYESLSEIRKVRDEYAPRFMKASFDEIIQDQDLYKFAIMGGRAAFQNNCALCHGAGGSGNLGYPNLTDPDWLWSGTPDEIERTIRYGIRSEHDDTRDSQMAAFGKDKILTIKQINDITDYVISFYSKSNNANATSGKTISLYNEHCSMCHGKTGEGNRDFGAPVLNDAIWLYGANKEQIYDVIYSGREGVMPHWESKLDDLTIKQLAIYVHQLGGGEIAKK